MSHPDDRSGDLPSRSATVDERMPPLEEMGDINGALKNVLLLQAQYARQSPGVSRQMRDVACESLEHEIQRYVAARIKRASLAPSAIPSASEAEDAARYRAWRDGDVIVRRSPSSGWEARHEDTPHWDVGSWHWSESLDDAIDQAMKDGGPI